MSVFPQDTTPSPTFVAAKRPVHALVSAWGSGEFGQTSENHWQSGCRITSDPAWPIGDQFAAVGSGAGLSARVCR
jgi:hypothetical protein